VLIEPICCNRMGQLSAVSFAGCGFLAAFHVGVAGAFRKRGLDAKVALGASSGSLVAAAFVLGVDVQQIRFALYETARDVRKMPLGAFDPRFDFGRYFRRRLSFLLPENAHEEVAGGRLRVALTTPKFGSLLARDFASREDLLQSLICSCFLPAFSGYRVPTWRGKLFLDGGLTLNMPTLKDAPTLTVMPLSGEAVIGPPPTDWNPSSWRIGGREMHLTADNMKRLNRALFPGDDTYLDGLYEEGYSLAEDFINDGVKLARYYVNDDDVL